MRVLPARWRVAVLALFDVKPPGDRTAAIVFAGYKGKADSLNVMASRIFADDRVRAAIAEECRRRIDTSEPETIAVVRGIMHDPDEKSADRLRAAGMMWDRARPVETRHRIDVEHHVTQDDRDVQHYRALKTLGAPPEAFLARFGPNGLARVEALVLAEQSKVQAIEDHTLDHVEYEELPVEAAQSDFDEEMMS
jgi:hypothetical protein